MVSTVANMAIDCANAYQLALFWSEVTGQPVDPEDGPGDAETAVTLPNGITLYFNQVPEPKTIKNRLHLCLRPGTSRDLEVERLLALGASLVSDHRRPDGWGRVVLADPEGNEFCILLAEAERAALPPVSG
ncbi:VOC family protein [Streptomyces althioticus]|uniref:VOC family protein n=1 Tax=Streptomyces althioticus TaxID=83380 RepID=UPI003873C228|nr:VOC family protein [Streptomyces althioticus]